MENVMDYVAPDNEPHAQSCRRRHAWCWGTRGVCGWRKRRACGLLGSSLTFILHCLDTDMEPTLATVNSHVGWIAFSSVPCMHF